VWNLEDRAIGVVRPCGHRPATAGPPLLDGARRARVHCRGRAVTGPLVRAELARATGSSVAFARTSEKAKRWASEQEPSVATFVKPFCRLNLTEVVSLAGELSP
jgi:hypothetical protein